MSNFIESEKIKIFPVAKDRVTDSEATLFTEKNLVEWMSLLCSKEVFVVSGDIKVANSNWVVESDLVLFVKGYLVKITAGTQDNGTALCSSITSENESLYVTLNHASDNELAQDDEDEYKGLQFTSSTTPSSDAGTYLLATRDGNNVVCQRYRQTISEIEGINISTISCLRNL